MYNILVIDDDLRDRETTYNRVFTNSWSGLDPTSSQFIEGLMHEFSLELYDPQNRDIAKEEKSFFMQIDALFIDYNLVGSTNDTKEIKRRLEVTLLSFKEKRGSWPVVFFVSDKWDSTSIDIIADFKTNYELKEFGFNIFTMENLRNISTFSNLENQKERDSLKKQVEQFRASIKSVIDREYGISSYIPKQNNELKFLIFSDLQFKSRHETTHNSIKGSITNELKDKIDFLIICGDIAEHGLKTEYDEALRFFDEKFLQDLLGNGDYRDRIILVPGNHDYDLRYTIINRMNLDSSCFSERKMDFMRVIKNLDIDQIENDNNMQGFVNFIDFARKLTEDESWHETSNRLNIVRNKFRNLGIRFVCINTVSEINALQTNKFSIHSDSASNLYRDWGDGLFNILIAHHSNLNQDTASGQNIDYSDLIIPMKIDLVLAGHKHKAMYEAYKKDGVKYHTIEAPTLRLSHNNSDTGYALLSLQYEKQEINKGELKLYSIDFRNNAKIVDGDVNSICFK